MTEKELGKLKRPDLLALLSAKSREAGETKRQLDESRKTLSEAVALVQRLKDRLDEKDEKIERLKNRLDEKDVKIDRLKNRLDEKDARISGLKAQLEDLTTERWLEMEGTRSLTDISARLDLMLRAAQKAVNRYMSEAEQPAGPDTPQGSPVCAEQTV